jgi:hypothetical protein
VKPTFLLSGDMARVPLDIWVSVLL